MEAEILEVLGNFARNHPQIKAIYKGFNPEESTQRTIYLLTGSGYDSDLQSATLELEKKLFGMGHDYSAMAFPVEPEKAKETGFMSELLWP